jgi:nitroreductase
MFKELVRKNRSYRRFEESSTIHIEVLRELVNLALLAPSGANLQPLKYILSCEPDDNARIFEHLAWAGYLKDWHGPEPGQRPSAYIIILHDTGISKDPGCDHGIAAQTILLGAAEKGLGGCMIGSITRKGLRSDLNIADVYEISLVIALGKPAERILIEKIKDGDVKYWRDENGDHHVPKRDLEETILPLMPG